MKTIRLGVGSEVRQGRLEARKIRIADERLELEDWR